MYVYRAYNLCIHSEFPLSELASSTGEADVVICLGEVENTPQEVLDGGQIVLGEAKGTGIFLFDSGKKITVQAAAGVSESMLTPNIVGSAMAVILAQRGLLVLHASCVAINNQAIAFMGNSGWGKSTFAASFHAQGYSALTDDVMAIDISSSQPLVIPSFPQFKLWPEAANSIGKDSTFLPPLFEKAPKLSYKYNAGFQETPLPLHRIYILDMGTSHEITELTSQEAFIELVRHNRSVNVLQSPKFMALHMQQSINLLKNVSFRRLIRQPGLGELPELMKLVEQDLGKFAVNDLLAVN